MSSHLQRELEGILASAGARTMPAADLLQQVEWAETELASIMAGDGLSDTPGYRAYVEAALSSAQAELTRRRNIESWRRHHDEDKAPYPAAFIEDVKRRVPIEDVMAEYVQLSPTMTFRRWQYRCPAHGDGKDRMPSGVLYLDQGRWWCYGCNAGGDAVTALISFGHLDFRKAIERLAHIAGMELPGFRGFVP